MKFLGPLTRVIGASSVANSRGPGKSNRALATISDRTSNDSSQYLYGICYEDISHSGDGGIYAELLKNRAFQGPSVDLTGYDEVGGVWIQAAYQPLSEELPMSMRVSIPPNREPEVGFFNEGWAGIDVKKGRKYKARFYAKTPKGFDGTFKVSIRGLDGLRHYADAKAVQQTEDTLLYPKSSYGFVHYEAVLVAKADAPNVNNGLFVILENGDKYSNQEFYFNLISLFPTDTYKGRENGLRKDIAEALESIGATMMRWPGANNLEGLTPLQRWRWDKAIGPLTERPGRMGNWGYPNTDGLGLHEYFEWCEDMNLEPILGVYDGVSLGSRERYYTIPEDMLQPYIDDVMSELEYCLGDETTKWGKIRAQNGRKEPFNLNFVEIGNEDWFGCGLEYRFPRFHSEIKKKYPDLTLIASTDVNITFPDDGTWFDPHWYETPQFFVDSFDRFDSWPLNNGTLVTVGEYQSTKFPNGTICPCINILSGSAEAVFLIGLERNSNKVVNSAIAPIIFNHDLSGDPAELGFGNVFGFGTEFGQFTNSTSFLVQQMFAGHKGDKILELQGPQFDPVYFVASKNTNKDEVYVKIANPTATSMTASFQLDINYSNVKDAQAISHEDPFASNCPYQEMKIRKFTPRAEIVDSVLKVEVGPHFAGVIVLSK